MRDPLRCVGIRAVLGVLCALLASAAVPSIAAAGHFVFAKGGDIWLAQDDGSSPAVLVTASSVGEVRLLRPSVQPGGDAVAFESWNYDTSRVYAWEAGKSTLVGGGSVNAVTASGSEDPDVTADRHVIYAFSNIAIVGGCGIFGCDLNGAAIGGFRWAALDGGGTGDVHADCADARAPAADPADPARVAYFGCRYLYDPTPDSDPFDYQTFHLLRVAAPDGDLWVAQDDAAQVDDPAWAPDGSRIAASETGADAGLWVYPADGSAKTDPNVSRYVLQLPAGMDPFASPRFVGSDRIAFVAQGDIWTVPATCDRCTFPASATRVTSLGDVTGLAWTSATSFRTSAPSTAPSTPSTPAPSPARPAALTLTALKISPAAFRAARRGGSVVTRGGANVTYRLSATATVRFTVQRPTKGRLIGGRCVKATRANRARKRCTRYPTMAGAFSHKGAQGANSLRFSGRLRNAALRPGSYRLAADARDRTGRKARERTVGFRVLRRAR